MSLLIRSEIFEIFSEPTPAKLEGRRGRLETAFHRSRRGRTAERPAPRPTRVSQRLGRLHRYRASRSTATATPSRPDRRRHVSRWPNTGQILVKYWSNTGIAGDTTPDAGRGAIRSPAIARPVLPQRIAGGRRANSSTAPEAGPEADGPLGPLAS
jgi:hypothetical protein